MPLTCIVTGSSRGIGKAIALRLAADGYDVCVNDIGANQAGIDEVVSQIKALGRKSFGYVADVTSRSEVDAMVKASVETLGPLNTMVANAGIAQVKALLDVTEDDMQNMFNVNVFGVHNCYTAAARQMIAQGPPQAEGNEPAQAYKIIGAASIVAYKPFAMLGHYSASKWAVRGLTQAFAMEMSPHKITVNAYAPGIVGTAMWDLIDEEIGKMKGVAKGETLRQTTKDLVSLGRTSVPEDVSDTVHFMASRNSDYMTGQTIVIDGGIVYA